MSFENTVREWNGHLEIFSRPSPNSYFAENRHLVRLLSPVSVISIKFRLVISKDAL